jgi:hypothetical protein
MKKWAEKGQRKKGKTKRKAMAGTFALLQTLQAAEERAPVGCSVLGLASSDDLLFASVQQGLIHVFCLSGLSLPS